MLLESGFVDGLVNMDSVFSGHLLVGGRMVLLLASIFFFFFFSGAILLGFIRKSSGISDIVNAYPN